MKLYYLYHHIRLDTNKVFYVGIGKVYSKTKNYIFKTNRSKYSRAYYINNRSSFWKNIISKTEYKVEIILESENINFIINKEIEHIKIYGRKDLNQGTLVNLTDGGEGVFNCSNETRKKMREYHLGRPTWNKGLKGIQTAWNKGIVYPKGHGVNYTKNAHESLKKKCYIYSIEGVIIKEFLQIRDMILFFGVKNVTYYLDKFKVYNNQFILSTTELTKEIIQLKAIFIKGGSFKRIALIDKDNSLIKKYNSISEAIKFNKITYGIIRRSIDKNRTTKLGKFIEL